MLVVFNFKNPSKKKVEVTKGKLLKLYSLAFMF